MARGRAPGAKRAFGFEKLSVLRCEAVGAASRTSSGDRRCEPRLYGSDTDPEALQAARRNLGAAGVERWVKLEQADVLERAAPASAGVLVAESALRRAHGQRGRAGRASIPKLGDALKKRFAGWRCYIFTADLRLPKLIRLEPSRRTPLWNGALECRLYEFRIVAGSHRRRPR